MENMQQLEKRISLLERDSIKVIMTNNSDTNVLRATQRALISGSLSIGVPAPVSCALLDLSSITKGLVLSRMTTAQRNSIVSPVAGLVIYNTTTGTIDYYDGTTWQIAGSSPWVDYSATSTIVGWSSFTNKKIYYQQIGIKTYLVSFDIAGTSNSTTINFSLPFTSSSVLSVTSTGYGVDSGATSVNPTMIDVLTSTTTVNIYKDLTMAPWTNTGTKEVRGQVIIKTD